MRLAGLLSAAGVVVAGCASQPIGVVESGARPDLAGAPGLAIAAAANTPSRAVTPMIESLRSVGAVERSAPGRGYLVEISYSERPLPVGAYSGATPAEAEEGWIAPPVQRRWWTSPQTQLCTLAIRVTDAGSGGKSYSARASAKGKGPDCGRAPADLAGAIAARLAPPG